VDALRHRRTHEEVRAPGGDVRDAVFVHVTERSDRRRLNPALRATARLSVFDLKGRLRARLLDREAVASRSEIIWDGAGTDGAPLPSGLYVLFLEAISSREGVLVEAKAAVAIVR